MEIQMWQFWEFLNTVFLLSFSLQIEKLKSNLNQQIGFCSKLQI